MTWCRKEPAEVKRADYRWAFTGAFKVVRPDPCVRNSLELLDAAYECPHGEIGRCSRCR